MMLPRTTDSLQTEKVTIGGFHLTHRHASEKIKSSTIQ